MSARLPAWVRWLLWLAPLAILCAIAALRLDVRQPINTNILSLLPGEHASPALAAADTRTSQAFANELLVLIRGPDTPATRAAALAANTALLAAGLQTESAGDTLDQTLAVYRAHRFALLAPEQAEHLAQGGAAALANDVAAALASPAGMVSAFGEDPGGYLGDFLANLPRPYPDFLPDGPFLSALRGGQRVYFLRLQVRGSGFASQDAELAAYAVQSANRAVRQACAACTFQATGAPLFADAARREAQHETTWLTVISTVLIMLLIAYVFRSLAPHLLAALQLIVSVLAASAAVIACFGSIQILTLVFGTTLLGIAIDYAFLYFSDYWFGDGTPPTVLRSIRPGLLMGLVTGVVAFAFLLLAGFPALTQIAVFSIAGLLEAGLVVMLIFPLALTRTPKVRAHAVVYWPQAFIQKARHTSHWRYTVPIAVLLLCIPGWLRLRASDDVRELQHFPPALMQHDAQIRATLGQIMAPGYFLIAAPDLQEALMRETALFAKLRAQSPATQPLGLSQFLPPRAQQQASLAAWDSVLADPHKLQTAFKQLGLPEQLAGRIESAWRSASHTPLTEQTLFAAAPDLQKLLIRTPGGVALLATATSNSDSDSNAATLRQAAAGVAGAQFVAPLARITEVFHRIRVRATWLVILGYLLISMLLVWRYGRREALRMLYPPLLALAVTLGALGWLGEPLTVFVVVALILILGLGRDYSVFLREGGAGRRAPALAVTLSALTMLCSFGLLAASRIPAMHGFGLATLIGILASYLSAPLSLPPATRTRG